MVIQSENNRLKQLVYMLCQITGMSEEEAEQAIISTETGNAVLNNNMAAMYEQQTENLYSIGIELRNSKQYEKVSEELTIDAITNAMKQLKNITKNNRQNYAESIQISKREGAAKEARKRIKEERNREMRAENQNKMNVWRIENANKSKRQKG